MADTAVVRQRSPRIITIKNRTADPDVVYVEPEGTVRFDNQDDKDYRVRLFTRQLSWSTPGPKKASATTNSSKRTWLAENARPGKAMAEKLQTPPEAAAELLSARTRVLSRPGGQGFDGVGKVLGPVAVRLKTKSQRVL